MRRLVDQARGVLEGGGDLDQIGHMLHETWQRKRSLTAGIATEGIDRIYEKARQAGALGGKLLGAGGAGFMVFYVPPALQAQVRSALEALLYVPFRFESTGATLLETIVPATRSQARLQLAQASV